MVFSATMLSSQFASEPLESSESSPLTLLALCCIFLVSGRFLTFASATAASVSACSSACRSSSTRFSRGRDWWSERRRFSFQLLSDSSQPLSSSPSSKVVADLRSCCCCCFVLAACLLAISAGRVSATVADLTVSELDRINNWTDPRRVDVELLSTLSELAEPGWPTTRWRAIRDSCGS